MARTAVRVTDKHLSIFQLLLLAALVLSVGYTAISISGAGHQERSAANGRASSRSLKLHSQYEGEEQRDEGASCAKCPACPKADDQPKAAPILSSAAILHNPRRYHVVTTVQGFSNHWQARIHYYWYKRQRDVCMEQSWGCDMGGFTRLLHSGKADDLMDEIPTVVVDPLPPSFGDGASNYIVLNRPYAFMEWLKHASVPEKYIVMCEADHLFMRPMPNMMNGDISGAALFTYINPTEYPKIVRSFLGDISDAELALVPRIGNSPTFVSISDFRRLAPVWFNTTMDIWNDKEAHGAWNWVLEMYGYALATYRAGQYKGLKTYENMLAHPPFDKNEVAGNGQPFYLLHLTYPIRFNSTGGMTEDLNATVWKFDKRSYMDKPPPRNLEPPPANVENDLAHLIISMFNEATANIPCWDQYVENKVVTLDCPGRQV